VVHAFGDGAGELGGGAIGTVVLDGCPDLLRVLVGEIRSCCTVAVRVDVSGTMARSTCSACGLIRSSTAVIRPASM
ncbi:MAG: hypothetical protein R5N76_04055, partial [Cutibacterium granulosum]|nr:hypothetical protein [Cutibacterium granulosum]